MTIVQNPIKVKKSIEKFGKVYKAGFAAGAAAQIEKDAEIADELHLSDKYEYRHECSNQDAAAAIRAQLKP